MKDPTPLSTHLITRKKRANQLLQLQQQQCSTLIWVLSKENKLCQIIPLSH